MLNAECHENQTGLPLDEEESMLQLRLAEIAEIKKANAIKARADALVPVLAAIREHGFTATELGFKKSALAADEKKTPETTGGDDGRKQVAPRYRDPESGDTWTGRGKTPGWMQRKIAAGEGKDTYLIDKPTAPPESGQPAANVGGNNPAPGFSDSSTVGDLPKIDEPPVADGADPFVTE